MNQRQRIGFFGENLAEKYLLKNGYQIIARNQKISFKEVDIIAEKSGQTVFVEVKTRTSDIYGEADESFGERKFENLKKALENYVAQNNLLEKNVQIDLISIDFNKNKKTAKLKHYKNIF